VGHSKELFVIGGVESTLVFPPHKPVSGRRAAVDVVLGVPNEAQDADEGAADVYASGVER
jgi:hypothetical protein